MDILWENPIILVIIVGIISSYFKKMKSEQPENGDKGKPNQRKVPPISVGPVARNRKRQKSENQQQNAQIKPINTRNDWNNRLDQRTNNRSLVENNSESLIYNNQKALQDHQVPGELNTIQIDKEKLIDGIIWSEILGPPRSKRPHRSIKNN